MQPRRLAASGLALGLAVLVASSPGSSFAATKTTKRKATTTRRATTTVVPTTAAPATAAPTSAARPTTATTAPPAADATPGVGRNLAKTWDPNATLTFGLTTLPGQLDPHKPVAAEAIEFRVLGMVYDRLFTVKADGTLAGMLATKWGYTPDGRGFDITIRTDAKFHDGTALDANAVKASLDRAKAQGNALVTSRLTDIVGVDVTSPSSVRVRLARPTTDLPYTLATYSSGMVINPKALADPDALARKTDGSGPYTIGRFVPNDSVSLIRRPDKYWDPDATRAARIDIILYADATAQSNAVRAGQIDAVNIRENQRSFEGDVKAGRLGQTLFEPDNRYVLFFNRSIRPLDDLRVRQAINHAINREALMSFSVGSVPAWQEFRKGLPGHEPSLENKYAFNQARSRQLLTEAGFPTGVRIQQPILFSAAVPADIGVALQAMLGAVGIQADVQSTNAQQLFAIYAEGRHALALNFPNSGANPSAALTGQWEARARNPAGVTPEYTALFRKADDNQISAADAEKNFKEVNKYITEQAWHANLLWNSFYWFSNPKLQDLEKMDYSSLGLSDFRYLSLSK